MRCALTALAFFLAAAAWTAPDGWFPFHVADIGAGTVVDCSGLNGSPAGADGFITARDGHFVDGSGERIRFLGTNLTFGDAFPDPEMTPKIAQRMARLGINCVRFHHMDHHHAPRGIWDPDYDDRRHLDPDQLDRLDRIIYELKQRGIYTNLNLHVSRKFTAAEGFENAGQLPKYDKGIDNIDRRMIALQQEYARDLLTHVNPYTNTAYVDEPCVAMVELNNENSALRYAQEGVLDTLPDPYLSDLQQRWVQWLRDRYSSTEALREAWEEYSEPLGEQVLHNGDFSGGTKGWSLQIQRPSAGGMETVATERFDSALHVDLRRPGDLSWAMQLHQTGLDLTDGQYYTLEFAIRADQARSVNISVRYDCPDWRMVGLNERVDVGTQWEHHSMVFRAHEPKPDHTRVSFNFLNEPGQVWLADVRLRPGGFIGLSKDRTLEQDNIEFPGSNDPTSARADWFEFIIGLEREYTQQMYGFLKDELGLHALVIDTQAWYGQIGGLWREWQMDYADMHAYWQHPRFPGRSWDGGNWYIPNTPMVDTIGGDTLTRLSMMRLEGKPYTISEYNHPAPNDYRAECMPMLAVCGAVQDWDGIFQFCYGETPQDWSEGTIDGYFRMVTDPAKVVLFPIAANLFRRADLKAASRKAVLRLPAGAENVSQLMVEMESQHRPLSDLWNVCDADASKTLTTRTSVAFAEIDEPECEVSGAGASSEALQWRTGPDGGVFSIDTPKTVLWTGAIAGDVFETGDVRITVGKTSNGYATVAVTAMDNRPIAESSRLLVVALNRVENQEMGWSEDRKTVGKDWGHGPPVAEGVAVELAFRGRPVAETWTLDGSGKRKNRVNAGTGPVVRCGPQNGTVWYEVAFPGE
ncbi:MAG: carbohydrate binding domain-containing protein [Armatimonadota bacterium]